MTEHDSLPSYDRLGGPGGEPTTWGLFDRADEVGTLSLVGAAEILHAAGLVRRGALFSLNWELEKPGPPVLGRGEMKHQVIVEPTGNRDDFYDGFHPQASTQWDALAHVKHPELGFYGGRGEADVPGGGGVDLGIHVWGRRGIAGRFVLLDIARARADAGRPYDPGERVELGVEDLELALRRQAVELARGDILLLRFGWISWYEELGEETRSELGAGGQFPVAGLSQDPRVAAWLWNHRVAAICADNPALEAMPFDQGVRDGFIHHRLIPMLGMAVGEMFALDALAADCEADGAWEGLFTAAPLNKLGGVGSPANALALK